MTDTEKRLKAYAEAEKKLHRMQKKRSAKNPRK